VKRRKLMMNFVYQLIDWFFSENLLQFRRTKIWEDLNLVLLLYIPFLCRLACLWIVFGATTRHPSPFLATSLSIFQNSSAVVMKKNSFATDVFVTMITDSHVVVISFMDWVTIVVHKCASTSCGYKYFSAAKPPKKRPLESLNSSPKSWAWNCKIPYSITQNISPHIMV